MSVSLTALASVLLALAMAGCLTPAHEAKLGEEEAEKVRQQMGFVEDAKLQSLVEAIGAKLTAVSEKPDAKWQYHVVDSPEPNAFALPGGYIYVTRGLIALVNTEDELAGVMGHEIGHVTARHSSKRVGAAILTAPVAIATGIAGAAVGIVAPRLGGLVAGTGQVFSHGLVIAPFSREQEHQADEIGQGLAAKSGYDPGGITDFLHTLDRAVTLAAGEERSFHFFDSHPLTPDRVEKTKERAASLERSPGEPVTRNRGELLARFEGIIVGPDPAQGYFEDQLFLHPEFDLAVTFPGGWKTANTATAVGGISPREDAVVALQFAEKNSSVDKIVTEAKKEQSDLDFERYEIKGLPAARTRSTGRGRYVDIILIGYRGDVFAIVGQTRDKQSNEFAGTFANVARSFRALKTSERARIKESRLRIRQARAQETPAAIAKRTGSTWEGDLLGLANGLEKGDLFPAGTAVKVPLEQPYTPR